MGGMNVIEGQRHFEFPDLKVAHQAKLDSTEEIKALPLTRKSLTQKKKKITLRVLRFLSKTSSTKCVVRRFHELHRTKITDTVSSL